MRISDWSSDVCSSDLPCAGARRDDCAARLFAGGRGWGAVRRRGCRACPWKDYTDPPYYNRWVNSIRHYRKILHALGARVYIDSDASEIGDVELGDDVSVCPQHVIRAYINIIRIGASSNIT